MFVVAVNYIGRPVKNSWWNSKPPEEILNEVNQSLEAIWKMAGIQTAPDKLNWRVEIDYETDWIK